MKNCEYLLWDCLYKRAHNNNYIYTFAFKLIFLYFIQKLNVLYLKYIMFIQ